MQLVNILVAWRKKPTRNYIGSLPGRGGFGRGKNQGLAQRQPLLNRWR